jgi:protein-tyrosine phosphatase
MRFVDIHSHLIPDLDDGARSLLETIEMLRHAHEYGTRGIVATPHMFHTSFDVFRPLSVRDAYARMVKRLTRLSAADEFRFLREVQIYLGSENFVSPEFLAAVQRREVLTLNGSRYLLVEFPPFLPFEAAHSSVDEVLAAGLTPVLAHVERYSFFARRPGRAADLKRKGCVLQVNAEAIVDLEGGSAASALRPLFEAGLVEVVASDGHDTQRRRPELQTACRVLSEVFSEETAATLLWENPARIVRDRELVLPR